MFNILLDQSDVAQALLTTNKADAFEDYATEVSTEAEADETVGLTSRARTRT